MPPFGGTAAGREQCGVKISKMCGKDVLSYGKDVFLFVRKQAKTRQAGKQSRQKQDKIATIWLCFSKIFEKCSVSKEHGANGSKISEAGVNRHAKQ